ncbi:MAG: hypothetical protein M1308_17550, partial [Actinobacteria bacterium]|nr:hypothetical protein [Actinomycetota bacterium]
MILSLISCSLINDQNTGKSSQASIDAQKNNESQKVSDSTSNDSAGEVDKKKDDQKQTIVLIKNTVPSFAVAAIKHEIKNIFGDLDIKETDTTGEPEDYSIIVDITAPGAALENYIILCAVTNFYNLCDNISIAEFKEYWNGNSKSVGSLGEPVKVGGNIKNSDADSSTTSDSYGNDLNDGTGTVLFLTEETEKI